MAQQFHPRYSKQTPSSNFPTLWRGRLTNSSTVACGGEVSTQTVGGVGCILQSCLVVQHCHSKTEELQEQNPAAESVINFSHTFCDWKLLSCFQLQPHVALNHHVLKFLNTKEASPHSWGVFSSSVITTTTQWYHQPSNNVSMPLIYQY